MFFTGPQEAKKDYAQLPLDFLKELREQETSVSKLEDWRDLNKMAEVIGDGTLRMWFWTNICTHTYIYICRDYVDQFWIIPLNIRSWSIEKWIKQFRRLLTSMAVNVACEVDVESMPNGFAQHHTGVTRRPQTKRLKIRRYELNEGWNWLRIYVYIYIYIIYTWYIDIHISAEARNLEFVSSVSALTSWRFWGPVVSWLQRCST